VEQGKSDMKILHCIWTMRGGGAERQLSELAPAMAARGHEVHVAVVFPGVHSARLAGSRCVVHQIPVAGKYDPLVIPRLLACMRRIQPDVVQTWLAQMDVIAGGVARLLGIPLVVSERSSAQNYPPHWLHRARATVGRRATMIVANSAGGRDYWIDLGVDTSRISVIPNFVPIAAIDAAAPIDDPRIAADDEVILSVGRMSREKNLATVVEALRLLVRERPRMKMIFCGEGPLMETVVTAVRDAGLSDRVIFAGFVSDVAPWLKRSSAFIALSEYEGHPNSLLEALAARVPAVVSDVPAFHEMLDERSAWIVPVHDAAAAAAALNEAIGSNGEAARRSSNARVIVERFSMDDVLRRYEALYAQVVSGAAAADAARAELSKSGRRR
jgi:glycosyltransferase involved in cell wall biosynthesis